jgi:hypothetical protein
VRDSLFVSRLEGFRDLARDMKRLLKGNRLSNDALGESFALNQFQNHFGELDFNPSRATK